MTPEDKVLTRRPRGKSSGQVRRRALEVIRARRDFLVRLVEKRREENSPCDLEAKEAGVLTWALEQLAPETHDAATDPPAEGRIVTLVCDAGTVRGLRIGAEYRCVCGNPDPLTGVTTWTGASPQP